MLLRMLVNVLPRQSVSPAISRSMRSDGFIGPSCLEFFELCRQISIYPRQYLFQSRKEPRPSVLGALVGLLLIPPETRLFHAQVGPRARGGKSPSDDTFKA